jgi:pimeloyl-ACP methyl ester carboxylesterase
MAYATINGTRMWYRVTGAGAPVVQIHGAGFGHSNFAAATPILLLVAGFSDRSNSGERR